MDCEHCNRHLSKVYIHHNQSFKGGQWEHIGFWCKRCLVFKVVQNHNDDFKEI